jgi:hypothetical protein
VYSDTLASLQEIQAFIDGMPEVPFWYRCLPNSFFLTTTLTVNQFDSRFDKRFYKRGGQLYFVTEVQHGSVNGRMPEQAWHLIAHPEDPRLAED